MTGPVRNDGADTEVQKNVEAIILVCLKVRTTMGKAGAYYQILCSQRSAEPRASPREWMEKMKDLQGNAERWMWRSVSIIWSARTQLYRRCFSALLFPLVENMPRNAGPVDPPRQLMIKTKTCQRWVMIHAVRKDRRRTVDFPPLKVSRAGFEAATSSLKSAMFRIPFPGMKDPLQGTFIAGRWYEYHPFEK